ncbi:hypothetical protein F383_25492 [Gossypium arboreum]|uniref:Uncharacterized protein n=1 Tax=Gossypium arboreum TaxID=29729 RepID=A0A0B0P536_GOSAR|nr:hypothetical protein F383_25492 [Gossypium arboreum]
MLLLFPTQDKSSTESLKVNFQKEVRLEIQSKHFCCLKILNRCIF